MVQYTTHTLSNGLKIILHPDNTVQTVAVNILYNVGARDEHPDMTGMAHLFEHLMFSGSHDVADYDDVIQEIGGENNAYTTNDLTNYYVTLPYQNLETALWVEADRMYRLNLNQDSLDIQKKVVIEEFKEHYINKPYGNAWKHLRELAYTQHPYQWMTIGKKLEHIEQVTLTDAQEFYQKFYSPNNAILCIAGRFDQQQTLDWCEQYFGHIPAQNIERIPIKDEPTQTQSRQATVSADVPMDAVWIGYPMAARFNKNYYMGDIISDILGSGKTAALYQEFVKTRQTFTEISCYHTGSVDNGLLVIEGKISVDTDSDVAIQELINYIDHFRQENISEKELAKIKNRIESLIVFEDIQLLNRANNLAYYTWLGNIEGINTELNMYLDVTTEELNSFLPEFLHPDKSNILYYKKSQS